MRDSTIAGSKGLDFRFATRLALHKTRPPHNMLYMLYVDGYSNVAHFLAISLLLPFTAVNTKIEPLLRSGCNVFYRLDSILSQRGEFTPLE